MSKGVNSGIVSTATCSGPGVVNVSLIETASPQGKCNLIRMETDLTKWPSLMKMLLLAGW